MALLFYRNIIFITPEFISEDEFNKFKKTGLSNISALPSFIKFHFFNSLFISFGLLVYYLNKAMPSYFYLELIWSFILIFWAPKIIIETYMYYNYIYKEKSFNKRLNNILNASKNYSEFVYMYDQEFIKSRFGKWLIRKFIKN